MNVAVLNLENASLETISHHVRTYGSMSIPEMLQIDEQLEKVTNGEFNLLMLLNKLELETTDETNKKLLRRITGNFELYKDILAVPML